MNEDLKKAVHAVVRDCLGVRPNEEVLIICNPATLALGDAMGAEAQAVGAESVLAVMSERDSHAGEPPAMLAAAMIKAEVVLAPTIQSLSHTDARKQASESGTRIATLPGATEQMLARVMSDDMAELRRRGGRVAEILNRGTEARITCDHGSDLRIGLHGRTAIPDAGELTHEGAFGNLPCGEGFIAPATAEGVLIVDGSIAGVGLVSDPVRLTVKDGHLVDATGPEGAALMELLTVHGPDGTNVAELGIGTNSKAILTGNILEDEKIFGTAHIAFGASAAIGGNVQVPVHLDVVSMRPEVTVDEIPIVLEGKLLV